MVKIHPTLFRVFLVILFCVSIGSANAQNGSQCYKPLTGTGVGARAIQNGLICLVCNNGNNLDNLTDADRNNYVDINQLVGLFQNNGVRVLDSVNTYPAGYYAGYVVDIGSSLLTTNVLSAFVVSTYNNGVFVESFSGATLVSSPLTGTDQGRTYVYAQTSQAFDEVRFTLNSTVNAISTLRVYYAMTFDPNCGNNENNGVCDDAIQGEGTVVTYNGDLVCALCSLINGNNIIDADKNNYAVLSMPAGVLATVSVGVLDENNIYPAGNRAGFVIGPDQVNALLDANVLNSLVVETYLFGTLQESQVFTSGSGLLSVTALSVSNQQKAKIGFITTLKFNEVRLRVNQPAGASLGGIRIYYAFEEPASCNDCQEALTEGRASPYTGTLVTGSTWTGTYGLGLHGLFNVNNVVTDNLTDYATYTSVIGLLGTGVRITVDNSPSGNSGPLFPAGTFGGFVIAREGGLVDVNLLPAITVTLYDGTTQVASQTGAALLGAGVLTVTGGKTIVGFKSPAAFNRIKITIDNGLINVGLGGNYRIYYAFVVRDTDNDGVPDCIDNCTPGPDNPDTDGDGIPDSCDDCNVGTAPPALGSATYSNVCPATTADLSGATAGNLPPGTQLTFHTGTPATTANRLSDITAVSAGTYYAAIYDPVNDCYGPTTQITVTITTCPAPPLAEADHTATIINTPVNGNVSTNDSDPQNTALTYNTTPSVPPSNGNVTINPDGTFTYTPNAGYVGVDSFRYTVCNELDLCATAWVHIAVSNPNTPDGANNAPLAENDYSQTLTGVPVTGNASSNDIDPDGNTLSYTLLNNTTNGTLVLNPDGSYTYTPNPGTNGKDTARYQVCDNGVPGKCDTALIILEVKPDDNGPGNDPPYAQNDVASTPAGTPTSGNVLNNDSDPNGDPLTATAIGSLPPGLTLDPDGSFTYNPPAGFTGTVSVPYQACDGAGKCDTATLTLLVLPSSPLAEADHTATVINTPVSGDLGTNDSDPQNSPLTYNTTASVPPSNGNVTINADGTFTYTPNNGFVGVDSFQYTVCNAFALCTTAWAHVAVSNPNTPGGVNNAPLAENDYSQTLTGVPVTGNASSNDIDPDGNTLSYTLLNNTSQGNLVLNPDGSYTYTPNPGTNGKDTARYQVCDNGTPSKCDTALIILEVKPDENGPANDPPYAQNDVASTPAGTPVNGNVLDNDDDPNGDPLTASAIGSLPPGLTLNPDGTYTYNPPAGFTGTISVPYQACDGSGKCDTATLTIVVLPQRFIDLTPSTRVSSTGFSIANQTERGIVVDISEILGSQTNNAAVPIQVRIFKSDNFTYTYDPAATSANAPGPVTVNNPDWELTTNSSTQMLFTLKPGKEINGNSFSSFVVNLKVLPGAARGTDNFNVTIIAGSGNEIDFTNNQVVRILNIF